MNVENNLPDHVAADSPPAIKNAGMAPGGAIASLVPQSLDDAFRLAKALAASGDMVPAAFKGKPEATMAAIVRGMEIGLAPMQSLASIAVINGRASLWGDALPALMQRAGHHIDVELTGEGDSLLATAILIRGDNGREIVRTFSAQDAKDANLWGKQGPWQQYKKRMLSMRARALAVRDGAADALMGLQIAEEVQDYPPMRDVTPSKRGFASLADKARTEAGKPASEVKGDDQPQTPKNEDTGPTDAGQEPSIAAGDKEIESARDTPEYQNGVLAAEGGLSRSECPYRDSPDQAEHWFNGYDSVDAEDADAAQAALDEYEKEGGKPMNDVGAELEAEETQQ